VADPTAPLTRQIPFSSLLSSIAKVVEKSNGFEKLQIDESPCSGSPARVHFTIFNTYFNMLAFCGLLAATAAAATPNPVIKLNNGVEMPQMAAGYARTPPCYIVTLKTSQIDCPCRS
jgi:hypothetical protein